MEQEQKKLGKVLASSLSISVRFDFWFTDERLHIAIILHTILLFPIRASSWCIVVAKKLGLSIVFFGASTAYCKW
jgi:hypothetical protein